MNNIFQSKTTSEDGFSFSYDVLSSSIEDSNKQYLKELNKEIEDTEQELLSIEEDIRKFTNQADKLDYMVAVASGLVAGAIDSLFVGEFSLLRANQEGTDIVNNFVIKIAKSHSDYNGDDLDSAVKFLEERYKSVSDSVTNDFGGGTQHHLRDFSHHASFIGLFFSLLTQFTGFVYGTDTNGVFICVPLPSEQKALLGKDIASKIFLGVVNWFFHLVSDMAGSSGSIGRRTSGTGIPGPILSLLKLISTLPFFKNEDNTNSLSIFISKLFNGTLLGDGNTPLRFDLRTEIGVFKQLGEQAVPVIVNESIVRVFYFIRRLCSEFNDKNINSLSDLNNISWANTLPVKNRTIVRMLTIASGVLVAVDLADASIRSGVKHKFNVYDPLFYKDLIVRVNFVGIGRFTIALGSDIYMGIQLSDQREKRAELLHKKIVLMQAHNVYSFGENIKSYDNPLDYFKEINRTQKGLSRLHDRFNIKRG